MSDAVSNLIIKIGSQGDFAALTTARGQADALKVSLDAVRAVAATLGVGAGIMGFEAMAKASLDLGKNIVNMSERLQMSTRSFQIMGEVARQAGLDTDQMTAVLGRLRGVIDTAAASGGKAEIAFETLGLNAKVLAGVPLESALIAIAVQVNNATDKTQAYAAAVEILGARNLPKLNEVLKSLAHDGFAEAAKQAKILSDAELETLKKSDDAFARFFHNVHVGFAQMTVDAITAWKNLSSGNISAGNSPYAALIGTDNNWTGGAGHLPAPAAPDTGPNSPAALAATSQALTDQENMTEALANETKLEVEHARNVAKEWERIQKANEEVLKLTREINDPFYELEMKAERIAAAMQAGTISEEEGKQALATLGGEMWDKGMNLAGMPGEPSVGQGGRQPTKFEGIKEQFGHSGSSDTNLNPDYMTAAQGAEAALMEFSIKAGSIGHQVEGVFTTAFNSIQSNLTRAISGTESWRKALLNMASTIESSMINAFGTMVAKYLMSKAEMFVADEAAAAKGLLLSAASSAKSLIMWLPAAISASISSYGMAAAIGTAAVIAAVAAYEFEGGGYTGGREGVPAGIVHGGEYVFSAPAVRNLGVENLSRAHEMAKSPSAASPAPSGGGDTGHHFYFVTDMNEAIQRAHRNPAIRKSIISIADGRVRSV